MSPKTEMNRLLIPTILTATVLIAGLFAFMPIDKASTVHTTIITNAGQSFRVSQGGDLGAAGGVSTYTLTCVEACIVDSITATATAGDDADIAFIVNINDVNDILKVALTAPLDNALGDLAVGGGVSNEVNVIKVVQDRAAAAAVDQFTANTLSVAAGGTVVVSVNNSTDAGAPTVQVTVVFTGRELGTTTPTAAFLVA